jgi:hypothetical protein
MVFSLKDDGGILTQTPESYNIKGGGQYSIIIIGLVYQRSFRDIIKKNIRRKIMTKNMGCMDKTLRVLAAVLIGGLLLAGVLKGTLGIILGVLAVVFILTSVAGFCPLYVPLKISTKKTVKRD